MKTIIENNLVDKTDWPDGPWLEEPDKIQWQDEATKLPCLIVRNSHGVLCGYVGVPKGHPWYEQDYMDIGANVHGGLTYADHCDGERICHKVEPGEDDDVWWLGFDCNHLGDKCPAQPIPGLMGERPIYRNIPYVREQCQQLAMEVKSVFESTDRVS